MGEFFQQVHVWVVKNCTPWYMDGPDLIYRGTWMGHFSFKNWYMDGWWVVALQNSQRHTPTQTKVEYPPGGYTTTIRFLDLNIRVRLKVTFTVT